MYTVIAILIFIFSMFTLLAKCRHQEDRIFVLKEELAESKEAYDNIKERYTVLVTKIAAKAAGKLNKKRHNGRTT